MSLARARLVVPPPLLLLALLVVGTGCRPAVIFIPSSSAPPDHGDHVGERQLTAKAVGCAPQDVIIRDHVFGFWTSTWAARCREQTYRCEVSLKAKCQATSEPLPKNREHGGKSCECGKDT